MPRKPPDAIADFFLGIHFGAPITPWKTDEVRYVQKNYKTAILYPFNYITGYVTTAVDSRSQNGSIASFGYTPGIDWSVATLIALPSGGPVNFIVVFKEELAPFDGDFYDRLWIAKWPCSFHNPPDC